MLAIFQNLNSISNSCIYSYNVYHVNINVFKTDFELSVNSFTSQKFLIWYERTPPNVHNYLPTAPI